MEGSRQQLQPFISFSFPPPQISPVCFSPWYLTHRDFNSPVFLVSPLPPSRSSSYPPSPAKMSKNQPTNSSLVPHSSSSTATMLTAPISVLKPTNLSPYDRLTAARLLAVTSISNSPISKACLSSMIHKRKVEVTVGSAAGIPDPHRHDYHHHTL